MKKLKGDCVCITIDNITFEVYTESYDSSEIRAIAIDGYDCEHLLNHTTVSEIASKFHNKDY
jgi:hypothetical protein